MNKELKFISNDNKIIHNIEKLSNGYLSLRIGIPKTDYIEKEDFSREEILRYPNFMLLINNNPDEQIILIERNYKAISKTNSGIRLFEKTFNKYLDNYQLSIYIQPVYDEKEFWEVVNRYPNLIVKCTFEFIRPNLANISKSLAEDLRNFQIDSNAHKTKLELEAPKKGVLEINENSKEIIGLVKYSSKGGGDISLKIKGIRKKIRTSSSIKTIEIEEINIENLNEKNIKSIFGHLDI